MSFLRFISKSIGWLLILPINFTDIYFPHGFQIAADIHQHVVPMLLKLLKHTVLLKVLAGFKRILRCNPWGTHGYDPVPPKKGKSD